MMKKNNFKMAFFIFVMIFPVTSFSEDYLKNLMTSLEIAITNESKKQAHVEMDVLLDNKQLVKGFSFGYYENPLKGTPDKRYHFSAAIGTHVLKVSANNGNQTFSLPIVIDKKGLYIDLRYQDGESPKKQKNYNDGRLLIQEGHFHLVMAPPGVIGYD